MSNQGAIRAMAASGQFTPQELKAVQVKHEKVKREAKRSSYVAALIVNVANNTNPDAVEAGLELTKWHAGVERAFMKETTLTDDPDQFLDTDIVSVSVARLRKMARKFADQALEIHASDVRTRELRKECLELANDEFKALMSRQIKALNEIGADNVATNVKVAAAISKKVK